MFGNSLFKNLAILITFLSIVTFSFYLNENTNIYTSLQTQSHSFKSFTDRKTILNIFKSSYKVINNHGLSNLIEVSLIKNKNLNNETNQPVPTQNISTTTISNPFLSTKLISNNIVLAKITSALMIISNNGSTSINNLELCPLIPPKIEKRIPVNTSKVTIADIEHYLSYLSIKPGGLNSPNSCKSRHRVAIIVPYRNREQNLVMFLRHMHPFLNKQQIDYGIFLVEPLEKLTFNRGLLLNIGFLESRKLNDDRWDCFIFHDVDLIPEDERNIYSCPYENPRHMSSAVNTFNYLLPYENIFGGVTSLTKEQMLKVNGYSNLYFGWGAEDDDFRIRVIKRGYKVSRYPLEIGRYKMAIHGRDQPDNVNRFKLLDESVARIDHEGLNTIQYKVNSIEKSNLYTRILVDYDENSIIKNYLS